MSSPLRFVPHSSAVEVGFWHTLASLKLDEWKLDQGSVVISAERRPNATSSAPSFTELSSASFDDVLEAIRGKKKNARVIPSESSTNDARKDGMDMGVQGDLGTESWKQLGNENGAMHQQQDTAITTTTSSSSSSSLSTRGVDARYNVHGTLVNFNTIEEFKGFDRPGAANNAAREMVESFMDRDIDQDRLDIGWMPDVSPFILHTFADIKKWKFKHWFCFPVAVPSQPVLASSVTLAKDTLKDGVLDKITGSFFNRSQRNGELLAVNPETGDVIPGGIVAIDEVVAAAVSGSEQGNSECSCVDKIFALPASATTTTTPSVLFVVADHSNLDDHPGSSARNVIALAACRYGCTEVSVLCLRAAATADATFDPSRSIVFRAVVQKGSYPSPTDGDIDIAVAEVRGSGWELNAKGKPGPRNVDLGSAMNPVSLAEGSVDLNLKLMRWRLMPSLDLETIGSQRCLLLGSGTLGCNVARTLMGWGVRDITLVDNGRVSFSNPVRQSLFTHADCLDGGRPKAEAAAERLREIFPSMRTAGINLTIPMAGHSIGNEKHRAEVCEAHDRLRELIAEHDVVFLLTDSRESRWLPTLIARALGKPMMNVALGFDSYLVMRHGYGPIHTEGSEGVDGGAGDGRINDTPASCAHGCYFCNDVLAPVDSVSNRSLDQQCTVTRPGLSYVASSVAVEMMVSVLNHPDRWGCAADKGQGLSERVDHPLGLVPQQVRGFLTHFQNVIVETVRNDRCTGCSSTVIREYEKLGFEVVERACNEVSYLEDLTGLSKLHAEAEAALEAFGDSDGDDW